MCLQAQGTDNDGDYGVGRVRWVCGLSNDDKGVGRVRGRGIYDASERLETTTVAAGAKRRAR